MDRPEQEGAVRCRTLGAEEITERLFRGFRRRQVVTNCWRKENGQWRVKSAPFIDDWDAGDYEELIRCLQNTIATGGAVFGAFLENALKGFASVEGVPIGSRRQYMDLSSLHVSADMRGRGLGRALFALARDFARERGAEKLYISAHSAVESQAFYAAMGCVEAEEYQWAHVEREPYDCQLECVLRPAGGPRTT